MNGHKDFYKLLAEEEFQNGIIHFDALDQVNKKAFLKRYSIRPDEFNRARTILNGLSFKGKDFSDEELNNLWKRLGIKNSLTTLKPKLKTREIVRWFSKTAAILFIPLFVVSVWLFYRTWQLESFKREKVEQLTTLFNMVSAPAGGKTKAVLPDGSEVWLNAGSSIRYPLLSKPAYREVELSGEGFFNVTHDPEKPMLVTASGIQVKVYGTTFNIRAYEDDPDIETVLIDGKISMTRLNGKGIPAGTEWKMNPGELGTLNRQKNTISVTEASNTDVYTGWINGKYVFKNTPFRDILRRLERLHNVEFVLEDKTLGDYRFDATFKDQNVDRIMEIFSVSLPIKWTSVNAEKSNDQTFSVKRILISRDQSKEFQ